MAAFRLAPTWSSVSPKDLPTVDSAPTRRSRWYNPGQLASGVATDQNLISFADVDGDGHADYLLTNGPTSAFVYNSGDGQGGWTDCGRIASGV